MVGAKIAPTIMGLFLIYNELGAKNKALAITFSEPNQIFLNNRLSAKPITLPRPKRSTIIADLFG